MFPNRGLQEKQDVSISHYSKAIAIYPEWESPRLDLGYLYLNDKNQPDEAMRVFQSLLQIDSTSIEARIGLGRALTSNGNSGLAIEVFANVLELDPTNKEALNQIVSLYFLEEHLEGAQLFNQRFFQFHPNAFEPYVHQGNLSLAAGDTLAAISYFEESLDKESIEPGLLEFVEALKSKTSEVANSKERSSQ